jgi:hypothetical protein
MTYTGSTIRDAESASATDVNRLTMRVMTGGRR